MFGIGWQGGDATVVDRRLVAKNFDSVQSSSRFEYVLDVHPDDGSRSFRGTANDPLNEITWQAPELGSTVRVKFRPKDHEVRFDRDDPALHRDTPRQRNRKEVAAANSPEARERWTAVKNATPGTPIVPFDRAAALAEAAAPPATARPEYVETLAAIMRAKEAGDQAEVARLKEDFKHRAAAHDQPWPPVPDEPHDGDPVERLERLTALRDRGALTDDEFAVLKARILGSM